MKKIAIDERYVRQKYNNAPPDGKYVLEQLFGTAMFNPVTERIKSFEDACAELNIPVRGSFSPTPCVDAFRRLKIIAQALNEGWEYHNKPSNENSFVPVFEFTNGVFSFKQCVAVSSIFVPMELHFKESNLSAYCATQFIDLYADYYAVDEPSNPNYEIRGISYAAEPAPNKTKKPFDKNEDEDEEPAPKKKRRTIQTENED